MTGPVPRSPAVPVPSRRRVRWGAVAALVSCAYVVGYAVSLVVLEADRVAYARLHDLLGDGVARAGLCLVAVSATYHAFDGLRVALADLFPRTAGWSARLRSLTVFATPAVGIPVSLVILWPLLDGVWS